MYRHVRECHCLFSSLACRWKLGSSPQPAKLFWCTYPLLALSDVVPISVRAGSDFSVVLGYGLVLEKQEVLMKGVNLRLAFRVVSTWSE